jgi:hypothetical protein
MQTTNASIIIPRNLGRADIIFVEHFAISQAILKFKNA